MRSIVAVGLALAATTLSTGAFAQSTGLGLGSQRNIILSAERMFGFGYYSLKVESSQTMGTTTVTNTETYSNFAVNLFGPAMIAESGAPGALVTGIPRLAFDYVLPFGLTVGGAASITWASVRTAQGSGDAAEDYSVLGFGIAPRVGYALPIGDRMLFWPRAGFAFNYARLASPERVNGGVTTQSTASQLSFLVNLEPTFAVFLSQTVGLTVTGILDIPITGSHDTTRKTSGGGVNMETTTERTIAPFAVGVQFGVVATL